MSQDLPENSSENAPAQPSGTPQPSAGNGSEGKSRPGLILAVLLLITGGIVYGVVYLLNPVPQPLDTSLSLIPFLKEQAEGLVLAEEYTDANDDMLADAPADAAALINPDELVFSVVGADDPTQAEAVWKPLMEALAKKTGKPVKFLNDTPPPTEEEEGDGAAKPAGISYERQLELLREGQLHLTAFSTGQVSGAVNRAGFIPLFAPADDAGSFSYDMQILVPKGSNIKKLEDLKGKTIGLVALSSNSGGKAPLVLLKDEANLLPGRDYQYTLTGSHQASIYGITIGRTAAGLLANKRFSDEDRKEVLSNPGDKYEAVSVASDILQQMVDRGDIKEEDFVSIYSSSQFPPLCFGVPHNLEPGLRAQIEEVMAEFSFVGNSIGERYKAQNRTKFARVNYKDDWKDVREIDAKLAELVKSLE